MLPQKFDWNTTIIIFIFKEGIFINLKYKQMKLGEFIEKFSHNNTIRLHYKTKEGHETVAENCDIVSMDWEVNKQQGAFRHYVNNEVVKILSIGGYTKNSDAINIEIERLEAQPIIEEVEKETMRYASELHISEFHENILNQKLLSSHAPTGFRDVHDFENTKFHVIKSIHFAKQCLEIGGTNEEKLEFLQKMLIDLDKFNVRGEK